MRVLYKVDEPKRPAIHRSDLPATNGQVSGYQQAPARGAVLGCIPPSRSTCASTTFAQLNHRASPRLGYAFRNLHRGHQPAPPITRRDARPRLAWATFGCLLGFAFGCLGFGELPAQPLRFGFGRTKAPCQRSTRVHRRTTCGLIWAEDRTEQWGQHRPPLHAVEAGYRVVAPLMAKLVVGAGGASIPREHRRTIRGRLARRGPRERDRVGRAGSSTGASTGRE
jgi:hypothetical protein